MHNKACEDFQDVLQGPTPQLFPSPIPQVPTWNIPATPTMWSLDGPIVLSPWAFVLGASLPGASLLLVSPKDKLKLRA